MNNGTVGSSLNHSLESSLNSVPSTKTQNGNSLNDVSDLNFSPSLLRVNAFIKIKGSNSPKTSRIPPKSHNDLYPSYTIID